MKNKFNSKKIFFFFFLIFFPNLVLSNELKFNASEIKTFDNGYIIVGYSDNHGFGAKDIFLTKLDQLGDTVWSKLYGTVQDEIGHTVVQTSDGGYAISGYTKDAGAGIEDMFLMKTDEHEQIDDICIIGVKI